MKYINAPFKLVYLRYGATHLVDVNEELRYRNLMVKKCDVKEYIKSIKKHIINLHLMDHLDD